MNYPIFRSPQQLLLFIVFGFTLGSCSSTVNTTHPLSTLLKTQLITTSAVEYTPSSSSTIASTPKLEITEQITAKYISLLPGIDSRPPLIKFDWKAFGLSIQSTSIAQPEWLDNYTAKLAVYSEGMDDGMITADISAEKQPRLTASLSHSDRLISSPGKAFLIDCREGVKMFKANDGTMISDASSIISLPPQLKCSSIIRWAPDETKVSIIDENHDVYLWPSNGEAPQQITENVASIYANWSPDSSELVIVKSVNSQNIGIAMVFDTSGKRKNEFKFRAGGDGAYLNWLTNQILVSYSWYDRWYYEKTSGQFLFHCTSHPTGDGIAHQNPQVSPDGRWIFIEQGTEIQKNTDQTKDFIVQKEYCLYDLQNKKMIPLLSNPDNYLGYAGWKSDNSILYIVNRPTNRSSVNSPSAPFGLLAYNIETQKFDLKFEDAIQVAWNEDRNWAFIVYADRDSQENLGLAGTLWNPTTEFHKGHWFLSDSMVYNDPAWDNFFVASIRPIPVLWSHSGDSVVFRDRDGLIILINNDGIDIILADATAGIGSASGLRWSPDDQHLLIEDGSSAWIVDISSY